MSVLNFGADSVNPHWHVPAALQSLEGEILAAQNAIAEWEPYLAYRLSGNGEHIYERGMVTLCIIQTAIIAERAVKTLIAQTQPHANPKRTHGTHGTHKLIQLYKALSTPVQQHVQMQYEALPESWARYAVENIGEEIESSVEAVMSQASDNFTDWRYTMERDRTTNGIPKLLLKASVAIKFVCWRHLQASQEGRELVNFSPVTNVPDIPALPKDYQRVQSH